MLNKLHKRLRYAERCDWHSRAIFDPEQRSPNLASHNRVAFSNIASKTGFNSSGEVEIICNTSEVAVCRSSDSERSRVRACTSSNSRTFSIAITAWSAKVVTSSISCCVKWINRGSRQEHGPNGNPLSHQRNAERSAKVSEFLIFEPREFRICQNILNMNDGAFEHGAPTDRAPVELQGMSLHVVQIVLLNPRTATL